MRFRILGPLEIWTGQDWSAIGATKWRALLAALLLNPGQVVSTDQLIAELWGDSPPKRAANLVSGYVLKLRGLMDDRQGQVLDTRAPGYRLLVTPGDVDAQAFEALVAQGRQALAEGNAARAASQLADALALWRGRVLADLTPPSSLVAAEADRLEESRLAALELRFTAELRCGRAAELIPQLRRLISDHPLREGLWLLLMQALEDSGRRAEAIAAYGEAREVLVEELGVDPGPDLQQLYQRLLAADSAAETGSLPEPEPPAQPQLPRPAQLPADIPDFTGRARHLDQLRHLLSRTEGAENPAAVAVAVVAGTPGLGKTSLAVHAAHHLRRDFPGGQLYVSLHGASEQPVVPDEALARLLRDLGVSADGIPAGQEERAALYRTRLTDRRILVVLDDARDAAQVRPLLPGSPSCAVIVTSRHRLAELSGSQLIDLDVLADQDARRLLGAIIGPERAGAEPGPVGDVLDACAGLPLAIRIAGARLRARPGWTVHTLATKLADQRRRVDELATGDLAVRACFDVSFDTLQHFTPRGGADAAHAFRLLGLWQGLHISQAAAAALLGEPEEQVADSLETLVDAHLLESPAPEWYGCHDLLRAYAAERARAEEPPQTVTDAITRLLWWYLRSADAAASVVAPYRDRVPLDPAAPAGGLEFASANEALEWGRRERANLVVATRQAAAAGLHDVAWKLPVAVMACFDRHGFRAEWIATHDVALRSARVAGDRRGEAWVLNNLGMVRSQQHDPAALGYLEQALELRRELGDLRGQAQVLNNIAYDFMIRGQHERAVAALYDALELQRQIGLRYGEGVALCNLAEAFIELRRYTDAIATAEEALPIARESASSRLEGYVLYNLGWANLELGHVARAARLLEQALEIHAADGGKEAQAQALLRLGQARLRLGQQPGAREAWQRALDLAVSLSDDALAAQLRALLGELGP
jgi:DNA-binding SARP family transcriptional activator/Tfp pilus assembly protein PilF